MHPDILPCSNKAPQLHAVSQFLLVENLLSRAFDCPFNQLIGSDYDKSVKLYASQAWLSRADKARLDSDAAQPLPEDDSFTAFTNVLRRSNPLLPAILTGPLNSLSTCLTDFWQGIPLQWRTNIRHYELKTALLEGLPVHLACLGIFSSDTVGTDRRPVEGFSFFISPPTRTPEQPPFPSARRDERLEATETLFLLSVLLSTAEDSPQVSAIPGDPVQYIPYYDVPETLSAPKWNNAASLALAARYFRRDSPPGHRRHVFNLDSAPECWVHSPKAQELNQDLTEEDTYRLIAKLIGKQGSLHGVVCYFLLKLKAVMNAGVQVSARSTRQIALQN